MYMILETPEIHRFLRHVQVVFITVIFPLVYGNGTCPDITNFNSTVIFEFEFINNNITEWQLEAELYSVI